MLSSRTQKLTFINTMTDGVGLIWRIRGWKKTVLVFILSIYHQNLSIHILPQVITTTTESNTVTLTFPEGYTIAQIGEKLEGNEVCTKDDFIKACNDKTILEQRNSEVFSSLKKGENKAFLFEGYIFPDTYEFYKYESAESAINRFLDNFEAKFTDEMIEKANESGYSVDEILTIASIIQKESGYEKEMGKVSSVLHNRLSASYNRLECDVTIDYLNEYVISYLDGDKERYNEYYNTYKCYGLPSGAICNPGLSAIEASLSPEKTDYMFFVTDKTQKDIYYYAVTYEEHLANCKKAGWN